MGIKTIALLLSSGLFLFVVELVRREKLTFKYAFAWLFFAGAGVLAAAFPSWVFRLAVLLGFELPSNFIFFALMGVFIFLSLLLTVFLCQQNRRNDRMAQKIGILGRELEEVKELLRGRAQ
ncbi:MAG: DUF2304 domain-containing protein [Candidatus Omnitrophica bacterium]|nr:DUF2304 domain-containing protein [Candidatus Omnitrophota bacterium]